MEGEHVFGIPLDASNVAGNTRLDQAAVTAIGQVSNSVSSDNSHADEPVAVFPDSLRSSCARRLSGEEMATGRARALLLNRAASEPPNLLNRRQTGVRRESVQVKTLR